MTRRSILKALAAAVVAAVAPITVAAREVVKAAPKIPQVGDPYRRDCDAWTSARVYVVTGACAGAGVYLAKPADENGNPLDGSEVVALNCAATPDHALQPGHVFIGHPGGRTTADGRSIVLAWEPDPLACV